MSPNPNEIRHDEYLDARGLNCPLPVLKAKFALAKMLPAQVLYVEATDPHATIDFHAYCARSGHQIIHDDTIDGVVRFFIRRAELPAGA